MTRTFYYICPYVFGPYKGITGWHVAMNAYIPVQPNLDNAWVKFTETLGKHALCVVEADEILHARMASDPQFIQLDPMENVIPPAKRGALQQKLVALGFGPDEIATSAFETEKVTALLLQASSDNEQPSIRIVKSEPTMADLHARLTLVKGLH